MISGWIKRFKRFIGLKERVKFHNGPLDGEATVHVASDSVYLGYEPTDIPDVAKVSVYLPIEEFDKEKKRLYGFRHIDSHFMYIPSFTFYWNFATSQDAEEPKKPKKKEPKVKPPKQEKPAEDKPKEEKPAEGTGGFGKEKKKRTPEEDAWLNARSRILWSVDVEVLKSGGEEYWIYWKKAYITFSVDPFEINAPPWPDKKPMNDEEFAAFKAANGYREWTTEDIK